MTNPHPLTLSQACRTPGYLDLDYLLTFGQMFLTPRQKSVAGMNWENLSEHVPIDYIMAHPDLPWDRDLVIERLDLTWERVMELPTHTSVWLWADGDDMARRQGATALALQHPDLPWGIGIAYLMSESNQDRYMFNLESCMKLLEHHKIGILTTKNVWNDMSTLPGISIEDILTTADRYPWSFASVAKRKDIRSHHVREYMHFFELSLGALSNHMDFEEIATSRDLPWDWGIIEQRYNIPLETKVLRGEDVHWNWTYVNPTSETWEAMDAHIDAQWPFWVLSFAAPTWLVARHPQKPWSYGAIKVSDITAAEVCAIGFHKSMDWNAVWKSARISASEAINLWTMACKNNGPPGPPFKAPFPFLSKKPDLAWPMIQDHIRAAWDWHALSKRLPLETIEAHPRAPWMAGTLATRRDIDTLFVQRMHHVMQWTQYDWHFIHQQPYMRQVSQREVTHLRQTVAARRIQRWWMHHFWNPASAVCQRRVRREWGELIQHLYGPSCKKQKP